MSHHGEDKGNDCYSTMKHVKLAEIDNLLEDTGVLAEILDKHSEEHIRWVRKVRTFLEKNLGSGSEEFQGFISLAWVQEGATIIGGPARPKESWNPQLGIDRVNREAYERHLKVARGILLSIKDQIERDDMENKDKIAQFYSALKKAITLCEEGGLGVEELETIKKNAESLFDNELSEHKDEISYRKFQALRNSGDWLWKKVPRPGSSGAGRETLSILSSLEELLRETVYLSEENVSVEDIHIFKGDNFGARKAVRGIIEQASKRISIIDSYLDQTILVILELFVSENPSVDVQLLASSKSGAKFKALMADLGQFKKSYPVNIELRDASVISHDRYILIDEKDIFHLGHSIRNLGDATSRISKVNNQSDAAKMVSEFNAMWSGATLV